MSLSAIRRHRHCDSTSKSDFVGELRDYQARHKSTVDRDALLPAERCSRAVHSSSFAVLERCPSCRGDSLVTTDVDDELKVRTCVACHAAFGVDDSLDAATVRRLLQLLPDDAGHDQPPPVSVTLPEAVCPRCRNDDPELFEIVGVREESSCRLELRCLACDAQLSIVLGEREFSEEDLAMTWKGNVDGRSRSNFDDAQRNGTSDPSMVSTMDDWVWDECGNEYGDESDADCFAENRLMSIGENESFGNDDWAAAVTGDEDDFNDSDLWVNEKSPSLSSRCQSRPIMTRQLSCTKCETQEVDLFEQLVDPSDDRLIAYRCLICDTLQPADDCPATSAPAAAPTILPYYVTCDACQNADSAMFRSTVDERGRLTGVECLMCRTHLRLHPKPSGRSPGVGDKSGSERRSSGGRHGGHRLRRLQSDDAGAVAGGRVWEDADGKLTAGRRCDYERSRSVSGGHSRSAKLQHSTEKPRTKSVSWDSGLAAESSKCKRTGKHSGRRHADQSEPVIGRTRIHNLTDLQPGDHIAWHKWYVAWHHAIVVEASTDASRAPRGSLTVIHYTGSVKKLDGHLVSVRLETISADPRGEELYRVDYPPDGCCRFPPKVVLERAAERLGEHSYNPLTNNCEHFARWCKTGSADCPQVGKFVGRMRAMAKSAQARAVLESVSAGIPSGSKSAAGGFLSRRAGDVFGRCAGAARGVKCGAIAANVAVNLAIESSMFARDALEAYGKYKAGAVSEADFRQQLCKHGCECAGGFALSTALGIVGQIFIPIPIVGGLIGCTLGNLVGRFVGAAVGKQLAKVK